MAKRWRIYCQTEGSNKFVHANTAPTICPTNGAHTVIAETSSFDFIPDHIFGDASDGDVTINADTSLARDMYYRNLTIMSSAVVDPNGWRIFVADTLSLTGSISNDGVPGTAGAPATSNALHTLGFGAAGGAGVSGGNGGNGGALTSSTRIGGLGGAGGAGELLAGNAGSGTIYPDSSGGTGWFRCAEIAIFGRDSSNVALNGGTGGGAGGGKTTGGNLWGGDGGGGGGVVIVAARNIIYTSGVISANGGIGEFGQGALCGGGGGGGGGCVVVISSTSLAGIPITASGGIGGIAGGVGGTAGTDGTRGITYKLLI
jgi:hypothetical protein